MADIRINDNICHLCTNGTPKQQYGSEMYYSSFLQRYLPYYELYLRKKDSTERQLHKSRLIERVEIHRKEVDELIDTFIEKGKERELINQVILPPQMDSADPIQRKYLYEDYVRIIRNSLVDEIKRGESRVDSRYREIVEKYYSSLHEFTEYKKGLESSTENELRERFNYPLIGEGWISETTLFRIVEYLLSPRDVIHHYRGKEFEGLEIDIWIPDLRLGIEYQGEQHFQEVKHWGGKEGLQKRIENDRRKREMCKNLNYYLVEFKYDENLTVEHVETKLRRYLKDQ